MNDFSIKRSLYFSVYFTFLVIFVISHCLVMTCVIPSQYCINYSSSNTSRSIHLFVVQWRHISSESAVITVVSIEYVTAVIIAVSYVVLMYSVLS